MADTEYLSLSQPPVGTTNIVYNGKMTTSWSRWFSSLYTINTQHFKVFGTQDDGNNIPLPVDPPLTTTQMNALTGVQNGTRIYNTTENKPYYYENGAWVEK